VKEETHRCLATHLCVAAVSGKRCKNVVLGHALKVHGGNGAMVALILKNLLDGVE
jgi:ribosomal protein L35AE/L33A